MNKNLKQLWWCHFITYWYMYGSGIPSKTKLVKAWKVLENDNSFWHHTIKRHGFRYIMPYDARIDSAAYQNCMGNFYALIIETINK